MTVPVRARRGRPRASTREEVESAGVRLFKEHGYEETTLDMICAEVGVSKSTFFRYFTGKSHLLWYIFDDHMQSLKQRLADAPMGQPTMETARRVVVYNAKVHLDYNTNWRERFGTYDTVPTLRAESAGRWEIWQQIVADFVARREGMDPHATIPAAIAGSLRAMYIAELRQAVARGASTAEFIAALDAGTVAVCEAMQTVLDDARPSVPWAAQRTSHNPLVPIWE